MRKLLISLAAVLLLVATACGGDGGESGDGTTGSATGATGATGGTGGAGCSTDTATDLTGDNPFTVTIQDLAFHPDCFVAKSEASITIENKDVVTHTFTIDGTQVDVTIDGGRTFNGESAGLAPGTYPFHCKIHQQMTGTVIVT
jgi:plastocyanin